MEMKCDLSAKIARGLKLIRCSLSSAVGTNGGWGMATSITQLYLAICWFACFTSGERWIMIYACHFVGACFRD